MTSYDEQIAARRALERAEHMFWMRGALYVCGAAALLTTLSLWGCPRYEVYSREMTGRAELAQATSNRQIKVNEAVAAEEAAKHLAQAEVARARGVAEANRIIGDSLKGNEDYLRYLWIHNLAEAEAKGAQVIYVPTETNLPILEASRQPARKAER